VELGTLDPPGSAASHANQPMLNHAAGFGEALSPPPGAAWNRDGTHSRNGSGYSSPVPQDRFGNGDGYGRLNGAEYSGLAHHDRFQNTGNPHSGWSSAPPPPIGGGPQGAYSPYGSTHDLAGPAAGSPAPYGRPGPSNGGYSSLTPQGRSFSNNNSYDNPQSYNNGPPRSYHSPIQDEHDSRSHTPMIAPSPRHTNAPTGVFNNTADRDPGYIQEQRRITPPSHNPYGSDQQRNSPPRQAPYGGNNPYNSRQGGGGGNGWSQV
jgi:hypothetical protein